MPVISNQFTIDAAGAINTLNSVQSAFANHNRAVGAVANQYATFNRNAKNGAATATQTLVQIDSAGRKVTTTLRDMGQGYEAVSVKVGQATASQRRMATELERQRNLADQLARSFAGLAPSANRSTTALPGQVNPATIGLGAQAYARISTEQARAAATARGFSAAQTDAFVRTVEASGRARVAVDGVGAGVGRLKSRFNELGQIAFATAIYRGLSLIQLGLTEGTKSAAQFSRQVGLIQTLSHDASDNYDTWSKSIRGVADELGLPVAEVATATYDALSNQVIKTTKDMGLVHAAGELARTTNSKITDSIGVLSSILNTYGASAGSAQRINDELFKTVDLGRVRMNELNGVIGRSAGIAKTAGVSLRELEAGLIVQTQAGLDSAESATLLNNVYSQLIKPNDALAAQFRKMGFDSGQAAVSTLGFAGVMRQLGEAAKSTNEGIATFFPEIRGLRGAATFAGEGIDKFEKSLKALEGAMGTNSKALDTLKKNLGQGLIDEVQRIKNFFTVDFGQAALETIGKITSYLGGLDKVVRSLSTSFVYAAGSALLLFGGVSIYNFGYGVYKIVKGMVELSRATTVATAAAAILGTTAKAAAIRITIGLGLGLAAVVAIGTAMRYVSGISEDAAAVIADNFKQSSEKIKKDAEETASAQADAFNRAVDRSTQFYGIYVADQKKANNALREDSKETANKISEGLKNNFQVLEGIAREGLSKVEAAQKKAAENSIRIAKEKVTITGEFEKRQYEKRLEYLENIRDKDAQNGTSTRTFTRNRELGGGLNNRTPLQNIVRLTNERNALLRQREETAIKAGDLDHAKKDLDEIIANIDHLQTFRDRNDKPLIKGLRGQDTAELQNYYKLTQQLDATNKNKTTELARQIEIEKQQVKVIEDLLSKTATFATKGAFDKEGDLLEKFANDGEAANKELIKLQREALAAAGRLKGVTDPLTLVQYNAALKEIEKTFGEQRANLALQVQQSITDKALNKHQQEVQENAHAQKTAVSELTTEYYNLQEAVDQDILKVRTLSEAVSQQANSFTGSASTLNRFTSGYFDAGFTVEAQQKIFKLNQELQDTLAKNGPKQIGVAQAILGEIENLAQINAPNLQIIDPENNKNYLTYVEGLQRASALLKEIKTQQAKATEFATDLNSQTAAVKALNLEMGFLVSKASPGLDIFKDKAADFANLTPQLEGSARGFNTLTESISKLRAEVERLDKVNIPQTYSGGAGGDWGSPEKFSQGGMVGSQGSFLLDFLSGRYASGTDTIPAMLTKKEFVVRAPMAERYYSQLVAMNAGTAPIYRAQGGPVSNTQVGDIHVTIPGSKSGVASAREFASAVRRGIKQGTLRIN